GLRARQYFIQTLASASAIWRRRNRAARISERHGACGRVINEADRAKAAQQIVETAARLGVASGSAELSTRRLIKSKRAPERQRFDHLRLRPRKIADRHRRRTGCRRSNAF